MRAQTMSDSILLSKDPPASVEAGSLSVRTLCKGSSSLDADILKLATFISRQPRFTKTYDPCDGMLLENLVLRFNQGIQEGRQVVLLTLTPPDADCESVIGYLYMKTTGAFSYDYLDSMERHACNGMNPSTIFKPEFRLSDDEHWVD